MELEHLEGEGDAEARAPCAAGQHVAAAEEALAEMLEVVGRDAGPVVCHAHNRMVAGALQSHGHVRVGVGVLRRVGEEVLDDAFDEMRVGDHPDVGRHVARQGALGEQAGEPVHATLDQPAEVDEHRRRRQASRLEACEVEEVLDRLAEDVAVVDHAVQALLAQLFAELVAPGDERLAHALDHRQGRAQLVRNRGDEVALEPVELGQALREPPLGFELLGVGERDLCLTRSSNASITSGSSQLCCFVPPTRTAASRSFDRSGLAITARNPSIRSRGTPRGCDA